MNTPNDGGPAFPAKTGVELIADERQRQITKKGYTAEKDSRYKDSSLAMAAICYALPKARRFLIEDEDLWPWGTEYWSPSTDRVRELVKAGALIAAEIDRLQRLAARDGKEGN